MGIIIGKPELDQMVTEMSLPACYIKQNFQDPWAPAPYLYCDQITRRVGGEGISDASFTWHVGEIAQPNQNRITPAYDRYQPLQMRYLVRVDFWHESRFGRVQDAWYGVLTKSDFNRMGDPSGYPVGDQSITAVGLEWFLSRTVIDKMRVITGRSKLNFNNWELNPEVKVVPGSHAFNTAANLGNSHIFVDGKHSFTSPHEESLPTWTKWSLRNCLEYLLDQSLFPIFDSAGPTIVLDFDNGGTGVDICEWEPENVEIEGLSILQALNALIKRDWGIDWSIETAIVNDKIQIKIRVHSFSVYDVQLLSGKKLRANPELYSVAISTPRNIENIVQITDRSRQYENVVCRGDFRSAIATFSMKGEDAIFVKAWTDDEETDYKAAATAGTDAESRAKNEQERALYPTVYRDFKLRRDWDGKNIGSLLFPPIKSNGSISTSEDEESIPPNVSQAYASTITLERDLRLVEGVDYAAATLPVSPVGQTIPAFVTVLDQNDLRHDGRVHGRKGYGLPGDFEMKNIQVQVGSRQSDTVRLEFNDAAHYIALNHYDDEEVGTNEDNHRPQIDYEDIELTIRMRSTEKCYASYPDTDVKLNNQSSTLVVELGDRARMDWIDSDTVIGIDGSNQKITNGTSGRWLRNDWSFLKDTARLVYQWHSTTRHAVSFTVRQSVQYFRIGSIIDFIQSEPVAEQINSMITSVQYDFRSGSTDIRTGFVESLDFTELAGTSNTVYRTNRRKV